MTKRKSKKSPGSCVVLDSPLKSRLKQYVAKNEVKGGVSAIVRKASRDFLRKKR
ncbi:MAG: hypothetical protein WBZ36_26220 [Candidatus Nitrosopolaris sp.]